MTAVEDETFVICANSYVSTLASNGTGIDSCGSNMRSSLVSFRKGGLVKILHLVFS